MAKKKNPWRVRYGTADGEIRFGDITADNELSAVQLRNFRHKEHYIALNETGKNGEKEVLFVGLLDLFKLKQEISVTRVNLVFIWMQLMGMLSLGPRLER